MQHVILEGIGLLGFVRRDIRAQGGFGCSARYGLSRVWGLGFRV